MADWELLDKLSSSCLEDQKQELLLLRGNTEIHHYFFPSLLGPIFLPQSSGNSFAGKTEIYRKLKRLKLWGKDTFFSFGCSRSFKRIGLAHCFICLSVLIPVKPECGSHHGSTSQRMISGFTRDPHQKLKPLEIKVQGEIMEREELIKVIQKYNLGKSGLLLNLYMHKSHPNGFKN